MNEEEQKNQIRKLAIIARKRKIMSLAYFVICIGAGCLSVNQPYDPCTMVVSGLAACLAVRSLLRTFEATNVIKALKVCN